MPGQRAVLIEAERIIEPAAPQVEGFAHQHLAQLLLRGSSLQVLRGGRRSRRLLGDAGDRQCYENRSQRTRRFRWKESTQRLNHWGEFLNRTLAGVCCFL